MASPLRHLLGAATFIPRTLLAVPGAVASPIAALTSISVSVSRLDEVADELKAVNARLASVDVEVSAMRRGVDGLTVEVAAMYGTTRPLSGELTEIRGGLGTIAADVSGMRDELVGVREPLEAIHETVGHLRPAAERLERLGTRFGGRGSSRLPSAD